MAPSWCLPGTIGVDSLDVLVSWTLSEMLSCISKVCFKTAITQVCELIIPVYQYFLDVRWAPTGLVDVYCRSFHSLRSCRGLDLSGPDAIHMRSPSLVTLV